MKLTSRERIMRIFQNKEIDRPALKLWGAGFPDAPMLHPAYRPVADLAAKTSDLFVQMLIPFDPYAGICRKDCEEIFLKDTDDPLWKDKHTIFHTPKGDLHMIERISTVGEPSYITEHMIKEPEDIERLLSLPYQPIPFDPTPFETADRKLGDRGVVLLEMDTTGYALHRMIGSENLAFFSLDNREELLQLAEVFSQRILSHVQGVLDTGLTSPFAFVGPEVYIPPLMSPQDFEDFVHHFEKPVYNLIHNHNSHVWVHCHGKVTRFIDSFIDMGVDVLNPLEPPINGDVDMKDLVSRYGNRIGFEGNIEIQEIIQSSPQRVCELIDSCVEAGSQNGRFVLCPSAGYMEYPFPSPEYIENLQVYLRHGLEAVEKHRYT